MCRGDGVRAVAAVAVDVPPLPAVVDVLVGVRRRALTPPPAPAAARLGSRARRLPSSRQERPGIRGNRPSLLIVSSSRVAAAARHTPAGWLRSRAAGDPVPAPASYRGLVPTLDAHRDVELEWQIALARWNRHQFQRHTLPLREVAGNRSPDDGHVDRALRDRIDNRTRRVLGGVERAEPGHIVHHAALAKLVHRRRVGVVVTQEVHADLDLLGT